MEKVTDIQVARKFLQIMQRASEKKLEFNLSLSDVRKLLNRKTCFYTGVEFQPGESSPYHRTFDRVDNSKGYIKGNVVACTYEINQYKADMSLATIRNLYKKLSAIQHGIDRNFISSTFEKLKND